MQKRKREKLEAISKKFGYETNSTSFKKVLNSRY